MKPISVIVTAYNEENYIFDALDSVLSQTHVSLIDEVLVVDDGSEDRTPHLVQEIAEDEELIRLISQPNQGLAAARNTGLRHARAEWICFLDADDKWSSNKLETQWEARSVHSDVALWYTDTWRFGDERRRVRVRGLPNREREALIEYFRRDCPIIPSTVMVRREVFEEVGGFDRELVYAQDTEMWARIVANYPVRRIPEALAYRRVHSGSQSSDFFTKIRYRQLVSRKLVERYPFLEEHVPYRHARLQYSAARKHLEEGARRRAVLRARNALSSDRSLFEAYAVMVCALAVPRPELVVDWAGRLRRWLRDLWGRGREPESTV